MIEVTRPKETTIKRIESEYRWGEMASAHTESTVVTEQYSFTYQFDQFEEEGCLSFEEYPLLAKIWDNDDDSIFDDM